MDQEKFTLAVNRQDAFAILALIRKQSLEQVEHVYFDLLRQVEQQEQALRDKQLDEALKAREAAKAAKEVV